MNLLFLVGFGTPCEEERTASMKRMKMSGLSWKVVETLLVLVPNPGLSGAKGLCSWPQVLAAEPLLYHVYMCKNKRKIETDELFALHKSC